MIQYYSTNKNAPKVSFGEALLQGLAPDKGLYMPDSIPTFTPEEIAAFEDKTYPEIAAEVFYKFLHTEISRAELLAMCNDAYNFEPYLEEIKDRSYIMRLDRGPTLSFKDFAGQMMGRLMQYFLAKTNESKLILTATSGDTGSAVAHAFYDLATIRVAILFPAKEVTNRQRKQMTTLGKNINVIAIDGKFDDAQAMVKEAFSDKELHYLNLTSANSINIGRLLPQIVYYFYAHSRLATDSSEKITFSIPSGNFGDMMGCVFAKKMGLPVKKILVATNANNEFEILLNTKKYNKIEPSKHCISSAMNVGHPSNLARLIELYGGSMDEQGTIHIQPDFEALNRDFYSISVSDELTNTTIKKMWDTEEIILEPHGAVGWACVESYIQQHSIARQELIVTLETAHPAKFPEAVESLIQRDIEVPQSLKELDSKPEHYDSIPAHYAAFKEYLKRTM